MQNRLLLLGCSIALVFMLVSLACTGQAPPEIAQEPAVIKVGQMTQPRAAHQATVLQNGEVLITGGCAGRCDRVHASTEFYRHPQRDFVTGPDMTLPRVSHAAVLLDDGRVLVIGGWTGDGATASAELYDSDERQFNRIADMQSPRMSPEAVKLDDGRVLIIGGEPRTGTALASAEIFDPETDSFTLTGSMQTPRSSHVAVAMADGRVLVTGGHRARGEILDSAEIFDPATSEFSLGVDMQTARHKHAAVLLNDGRVMVIAGSGAGDFRERYASTEIYDPETGLFSAGPALHARRHKIRDAVLVLTSGSVLVGGGAVKPEVWSPGAERFTQVSGELGVPAMFSTLSILNNSEMLFTGGYGGSVEVSREALLFR